MSSPPIKQAAPPPTTEQRGSKRAAPASTSVSPTQTKKKKEEDNDDDEIVVLDSTPEPAPPSKKARTSTTIPATIAATTTTTTPTTTGVSSAGKGKPTTQNGKTGAFAGKKDAPTGGVKKTIFMPGFGVKPPSAPALPAKLAETLSIPLPSTSTSGSNGNGNDKLDNPTATATVTAATLKRDFVEALPDDLKELLQMEIETMGDDWFVALRQEFVKPYFRDLKKFVMAEQKSKKVFPPAEDVYSWTRLCPLSGIRVVVIGQDPYHDDGQAHGLAFSVRKGIRTPPSLRNIYKELGEEVDAFTPPSHGHLTSWARQGVLLLNTCLTVRAHEAASHSKKGWETFTTAVLKTIIDRLAPTGSEQGAQGVVFLAWGAPAGKLCVGISEKSHHVLRSAHPSPLAASRGFFGNKHFVKCNEWLESKYGAGKGIDWTSVMRD